MPHGRFIFTLSLLVAATAAVAAPSPKKKPDFHPSRVIVLWKSDAGRGAALGRHGLGTPRHLSRTGLEVVDVPRWSTVDQLVADLAADPDVALVEPDYKV